MVEARHRRTEHGERFIEVETLRVPGDDNTRRIRFLNEIVQIIGVYLVFNAAFRLDGIASVYAGPNDPQIGQK